MKRQRLQARSMHPCSYRGGEWANVAGVFLVTPVGCPPRACFEFEFSDGFIDFTPITEDIEFRAYEPLLPPDA